MLTISPFWSVLPMVSSTITGIVYGEEKFFTTNFTVEDITFPLALLFTALMIATIILPVGHKSRP